MNNTEKEINNINVYTNSENNNNSIPLNKNPITNNLRNYFYITNEFERIKSEIKSNKEEYYFLRKLLNLFQYKFQSPIKNSNFYHYAAESWILTIFKQLQNELKIESNINFTFNDLLEKIYNMKLDENNFLENLEILLSTYKTNDHILKITQIKLAGIFLEKLQKSKELTLRKRIVQNLSRNSFEGILSLILVKALNLSLNEMDVSVLDKNSTLLLNALIELKADENEGEVDDLFLYNLKTPSLQNYFKIVNEKRIKENYEQSSFTDVESLNKNVQILNAIETFYYFATTNFKSILDDILIFNLNSSNLLCKIEHLLKSNLIKIRTYTKSGINYIYETSETFPTIKFLKEKLTNTFLKVNQVNRKNIDKMKNWISASYFVGLSQILFYEGIYKITKVYLYDRVFCLIKDVIIFYSKESFKFVIKIGEKTKQQISNICEFIVNYIKSFISEDLNLDSIMKIYYYEDNKYITIEVNKSVLKFVFLLQNIININLLNQLVNIQNISNSKNYLVKKFRNILLLDENKSKEEKENKTN